MCLFSPCFKIQMNRNVLWSAECLGNRIMSDQVAQSISLVGRRLKIVLTTSKPLLSGGWCSRRLREKLLHFQLIIRASLRLLNLYLKCNKSTYISTFSPIGERGNLKLTLEFLEVFDARTELDREKKTSQPCNCKSKPRLTRRIFPPSLLKHVESHAKAIFFSFVLLMKCNTKRLLISLFIALFCCPYRTLRVYMTVQLIRQYNFE